MYKTGISTIKFLHKNKKSWCAREQIGPRATLLNPVFNEKSKEDEVVEEHFMDE